MSQAGITRTDTCVAAPSTARSSTSRISGSTCFESFSSASGRVRWPCSALVVEQDAGDDERAGERAPARLVRAATKRTPSRRS